MEQTERRPDATALVMGGDSLTYGQLDALSNQLARTLKAAGCERGDRVCFLLPKSPLAIVSMLGILKAGCGRVAGCGGGGGRRARRARVLTRGRAPRSDRPA